MKKILLGVFSIFFLYSCSDKLSEREAKKIIQKCIEENNKNKNIIRISIGENVSARSIDTLKYQKLATDGYLVFSKNPKKRYDWGSTYNITLTDKSKPFIEEMNSLGAEVLTSNFKVEKVNYITEIPAYSAAEANVEFKNYNNTPFDLLSLDKKEFVIKKIPLKKTSDGWKFCE